MPSGNKTHSDRSHTLFGIASLIIAIVVGFVSFCMFMGMVMLMSITQQPGEAVYTIIGLLVLGSIAIALIGLTLGIIGLFQPSGACRTAHLKDTTG